jgi:hypothetical protein
MSQFFKCFGFVLAAAVVGLAGRELLLGADAPPASKGTAAPGGKSASSPKGVNQIHKTLAHRITFEFDRGPLRESLDFLIDTYGVEIRIDTEAFKREGITDIENQEVKLKKISNARLDTVLRLLLIPAQATFLVRADHIEVTTLRAAATEVWGSLEIELREDGSSRKRPLMRLVNLTFDQTPLPEALEELAAASGSSVVLDRQRAGDHARLKISMSLNNVPVDTAVRLLANQSELKLVMIDSVLLVTTPENAAVLESEQEKANSRGLDYGPVLGPPGNM